MEFPQKNYLASQRMISSAILATAPHQLEQTGMHGTVVSPTSEANPSSSQKGFLTPKGILPPSVSPNMRGDPSSSPQVGFGPTGSFPYGISGVSMPSYGYQSELFKYVSNGTPRKSRMCCYCGKVFTRSTTRRYHERRCPLLRAAGSLAKDGEPPPPPPPPDIKTEPHESPKNHKDCFSPPAHSTPNTFKIELPESNQQNTYGYTNVIVKSENRELPHTSHNVEPHEEDFEVPTSINTPESHTSVNLQNSQALAQKSTENIPTSNLNLFDVNFSAEQFASQEIDRLFGTASDNVSIKDESFEPDSVDVYPENSGDHGDLPVSKDIVGSASGITYTSEDNEEMNDDDDETESPAVTDRKDKPVCRCSICGKGFESTRLLQIHEQLHTKFKPYACRYCSKRFAKIALRIKHECTHNLSSEKSYSCPLCHTVFAKRYHLQLHLNRIHSEPPIKCPYCTESFPSLHDIGKHLELHDIQESEKELLYMLGENVDDSTLMDTDENSMNGTNGSVREESIGENGDSAAILENQKIIRPLDTETCKHCGLDFHKSQMRFHEKEHAAEKPYECPICQKRFGYRNNLKSHLKLHEGIKPYHCQVCNARFTRGSTLRRHARKHGIYPESLWDMFLKSEKASRTSPKSSSFQDQTSSSLQHSVTSAVNSTATYPSVRKSPYTAGQQNAITQSAYSSFNSGLSSATSMLLAASPYAANFYANPSLQCNALNLSLHDTHKPELPQDISSSISHSTPRSTPSVELHQDEPETKVGHVSVQVKPAMFSTSVQANLCCKSSDSVPVHTRPSSTESSHLSSPSSFSGSEVPYGSLKDSKGDNVSETLAGFVSSGKLFKCDLCECFYTEYAMYRIHKRLHIRGYDDPYICPVCEEDCHDRVYFSLHIYEHLH